MSEDEGDLLRWASRLFETLESANNPRPRVVAAIAGFLVTAGMWLVHLRYPSLILELGLLARGIVVAPPLVSVMSIGYLVFPEITEERDVETGPMSGYMRMVKSDRRWKITVTATATGAANLMLMLFTSRAARRRVARYEQSRSICGAASPLNGRTKDRNNGGTFTRNERVL
jgi:hypothetical protein